MITQLHLAYILLFVATLLLVEGGYFLISDWRHGGKKAVNRRLRLIAGGDRSAMLAQLRKTEGDPLSAAIGRVLPFLPRLLVESGTSVPLARFVVLCVAAAVFLAVALWILVPWPLTTIIAIAAGVGFAGPILVLRSRRAKRLEGMGQQLPEALDMMVRALKAGHPINSAIGLVASEMADPVGTEFGIVVDEMTYGLDLNSALRNLTTRIPHPDLQFFTVTVQIQHQTGGNLGEVLTNLSNVIRDRFAMAAKVRAITSQSRMAAMVIGMMPILTTLAVAYINPGYFGEVMDDPYFKPGMMLAAFMMLAGQGLIMKLLRFRF